MGEKIWGGAIKKGCGGFCDSRASSISTPAFSYDGTSYSKPNRFYAFLYHNF